MAETLVTRVRETKVTGSMSHFSADAKEATIKRDLESSHAIKDPFFYAPRVYAIVMTFARNGWTKRALKYAAIYDKMFKLTDSTVQRVYRD